MGVRCWVQSYPRCLLWVSREHKPPWESTGLCPGKAHTQIYIHDTYITEIPIPIQNTYTGQRQDGGEGVCLAHGGAGFDPRSPEPVRNIPEHSNHQVSPDVAPKQKQTKTPQTYRTHRPLDDEMPSQRLCSVC